MIKDSFLKNICIENGYPYRNLKNPDINLDSFLLKDCDSPDNVVFVLHMNGNRVVLYQNGDIYCQNFAGFKDTDLFKIIIDSKRTDPFKIVGRTCLPVSKTDIKYGQPIFDSDLIIALKDLDRLVMNDVMIWKSIIIQYSFSLNDVLSVKTVINSKKNILKKINLNINFKNSNNLTIDLGSVQNNFTLNNKNDSVYLYSKELETIFNKIINDSNALISV